jgi:hypothetical protein
MASRQKIFERRGTRSAKQRNSQGLLLGDFRRSAVRNMICRGLPQKTKREISGHKTASVFSRYNVVSEADIREAHANPSFVHSCTRKQQP